MYRITHKWNHDFPQLARDSGFKFFDIDTHSNSMDWRQIGHLDIEKLKNDSNFDKLNQIIPQITEAPIATLLNNPILDPALTKYFFAAQLIIQYLTFCLQCLDQAVSDLHMSVYEMETEKQDATKLIRKQNDDLNYLQKKLNRAQHSCKKCSKNFVSDDMLDGHMTRKHLQDKEVVVVKDLNLINTIKLELEVKHLKERLNNAEKELQDRRHETMVTTPVSSPRRKLVCSCCCNNEPRKISSHEIGIQSNLGEPKEADDNVTDLKEQMEKLIDSQCEMMQKWKAQTDGHKHEGEVELITQKFDQLLTVMENLNESFQTIKSTGRGNDETNLIKTKIIEIEQSQQLSHRKIHESLDRLDLDYVEKLGDIQNELGKISKYLAEEKTSGQSCVEVIEAVQPAVKTNSVPETVNRVIVHQLIESETDSSDTTVDTFNTKSDEHSRSSSSKEIKDQITVKPKSVTATIPVKPEQPLPIDKDKIKLLTKNLFKSRLRSMGVNLKTKSIQAFVFEKIQKRLVENRTKQRNEYSSFMKVRKELLTDATARVKSRNVPEKIQQVIEQVVKTPKSMAQEENEVPEKVVTRKTADLWRTDTFDMSEITVVRPNETPKAEKQTKKKVLFVDNDEKDKIDRLEDILDSDDVVSDLDFTIPY